MTPTTLTVETEPKREMRRPGKPLQIIERFPLLARDRPCERGNTF